MQFGTEIIVAAKRHARDLERGVGRQMLFGKRPDYGTVIARRLDAILSKHRTKFAQTVEHGQHPGDERGICRTVPAPHLIERVFGSM